MKRLVPVAFALMLCWTSASWSQQLLVFPAVTDEQPGMNGSLWITTARVIKTDPESTVTIRRAWVALRTGGFADDPDEAPTWNLAPGDPHLRALIAWGTHLLEGTNATVGAVAFEVEGGEVVANANAMDVRWGAYEGEWFPTFGQGQFIPAIREPLRGSSHIPWLGGCWYLPCTSTPDGLWSFLRNNIGIINPNSVPLGITGTSIPFGGTTACRIGEIVAEEPETFHKVIPAYGWLQFPWVAEEHSTTPFGCEETPHSGFVVSLAPDDDLPYYAYASVVFSPDPESGAPEFNDPMFISAEPGFVAPYPIQ